MKYVFVVCGTDEHIDTLHFSLRYLQHFSDKDIWVITDTSRNTKAIMHPNLIDVATPKHYNHHQASIYLKTSLHRYLPKGDENTLWCYLDTDVVATTTEVDAIFKQYQAPITFCTDHCRLPVFSISAVPMLVTEKVIAQRERLKQAIADYDEADQLEQIQQAKESVSGGRFLLKQHLKLLSLSYAHHNKYIKSIGTFIGRLSKRIIQAFYTFDADNTWRHKDGTLVFNRYGDYDLYICGNGFFFNPSNHNWCNAQGEALIEIESNRLREAIRSKFKVNINIPNWQHWNGGVFLFDEKSHAFLDNWHNWTMQIFEDKSWGTRDQGTLAATAWKFKLQHHPTLPLDFNFLVSQQHKELIYQGHLEFELHKKPYSPRFLHIYQNWADMNWAIWLDIEKLRSEKGF